MQARSATLAIAALAFWLVPSASLAQGNSGKSRLTICHIQAGNREARRTLTISESAWSAHESHGDTLGPCDEFSDRTRETYGDDAGNDAKRAKKNKKAKKMDRKKSRSGSDGEAAGDDSEGDHRAKRSKDVDSGSDEPEANGADRRARREQRQAERRDRERRIRDQADPRIEDGQTAETTGSDESGEAKAGDAETGTDAAPAAEGRTGRKARAARRSQRATQPDAEAAPAEEPGFFNDMRQFFGFGADEAKSPSGDEPSGDAVE